MVKTGTDLATDVSELMVAMGESFVDSWRNDAQVYGECENYGVMKGHANAVLEAQISAMAARVKGFSSEKTFRQMDFHP